jgi:ubiquinone/menaquinone biosynthesis C-methylase UbiE
MMNSVELQAYQQAVADYYSGRSRDYDRIAWHERIAHNLLTWAHIAASSNILDIATGTGMLAFHAAAQCGAQGTVTGIDIAEGMLQQAAEKLTSSGLTNLRFESGNGENLRYPENSFDYIFCSSALIWMSDPEAALLHWKTRLKPGGKIGFHAFSEQAFVAGAVAQAVLETYAVTFSMNRPTGTPDKCRALLQRAGYAQIEIIVEAGGNYISLAEAKNAWALAHHPAPGQYPHPMAGMTAQQLVEAKMEFERRLELLNTPKGIWNDMTTFYVYAVNA